MWDLDDLLCWFLSRSCLAFVWGCRAGQCLFIFLQNRTASKQVGWACYKDERQSTITLEIGMHPLVRSALCSVMTPGSIPWGVKSFGIWGVIGLKCLTGSTLSHLFSVHFAVERTPKTFLRQCRLGACLGVGMCHYPDGWAGHSLRSSTIQMNPCGPKSNLVRFPIKGNQRRGEPQGLDMGYQRGLHPVPNLQRLCAHI